MNNNTYHIDIKGNTLILKTTSFKAERGSILHAGIFNKDLISSFAGGALILLIYLILRPSPTAIYYILIIIQFIAFFIFFRSFVFYEPSLEAVVDKDRGEISITVKKFLGKKNFYLVTDLKGLRQEHIVITPENPDGIRVVEKVALQHGTLIPGFGETKEFYTVELDFRNGKAVMVFSSKEPSLAKEVYTKLKGFLLIGNA